MQRLTEQDVREMVPEKVHQNCTLFMQAFGKLLHSKLISEENEENFEYLVKMMGTCYVLVDN